ncbi:polyprenyl synthetase family protein [candidate division KSB1 bacterium]
MTALDDIFKLIESDLETFNSVFPRLLKSHVRIVNIIARHMVRQRGKRVRPALVIFSARMCGEPSENTYKAAALIEMLHNATLIHDDVVDDASVRRGGPTLNAIWKNKISVLMGDYILARSLITAAELQDLRVIAVLSNASARLSQGELNQLVKSRNKKIDEQDYFQIIGDKTAALFSASCELGAVSAGADPQKIAALKEFGEKIGLAFQIKDDLLDFEGDEKLFGKRKGTDLRDGKITLPLIHALGQVDGKDKKRILKKVKKKATGEDISAVIGFMKDNGGMDYAARKADELVKNACGSLDIFPDSEYKRAMISLTQFFINRKK